MYSQKIVDFVIARIPVSKTYTKTMLVDDINKTFGVDFTIRKFNDWCRWRNLKPGRSDVNRKYPLEMEAFIRSRIPLKKRDDKKTLLNDIIKKFKVDMNLRQLTDYCFHRKISLGIIKVRKRLPGTEFVNNNVTYVVMPDGKRKNKAVMLWENEHGPIDKDERIIFLDGNRSNFDMDNLFLVTSKELGHLSRSRQLTDDPIQTKVNILYYRQRTELRKIGKKLGLVTESGVFIEESREYKRKYADSHREQRRESSRRYLERMRSENPEKYKKWIKKCNSYKKKS